MNIFALSTDPKQAAQWHVNTHVVKMPVESRQMLSCALHTTLPAKKLEALKSSVNLWGYSHPNHPSTLWARSSLSNWRWLRELAYELLVEHEHRYGLHRSEMWSGLRGFPEPPIPDLGLEPFSLAMPDHFKDLDLSPVMKYRVFYANDKSRLFAWKKRLPPAWMPSSILPNALSMQRRFGRLDSPFRENP